MKRFLSFLVLAITLAFPVVAQVQFVPYRSVEQGNGLSNYQNQQRQQPENLQTYQAYFINQRGAFERINIRVKIVEQYGHMYVIVRAYYDKMYGEWRSINVTASEVDVLDSQVIKENFNYKFHLTGYGYVYF